ncbi:MAG: ATP synthase F1 subunit delta [Armatimonadota bacterium]|jgi:F-type H+-transporting ATPase subunit delta
MVDVKAAKRYSKALFALAQERGLVERIRTDLRHACAIVAGTPALATFMVNPLVSHDAKEQLLARGLSEMVSAESMDFVRLLLRRDRGAILGAVLEQFELLADEAAGVVRARVESAVPLTEQEKARLIAAVQRRFGRTPIVDYVDAPELIGGVRMRVWDTVIDDSLQAALARLREQLRSKRLRAAR